MSDFVTGLFVFWCFAALVIHVVTCVATNWAAMLIIGLIFFPVGVIHGTGVAFGIW